MATLPPALLAMLEAQKAEYRQALPARLDALQLLWAQVLAGQATAATLADLERQSHGLAGSGATFGLAAMGRAARAVELAVQPWAVAGPPLDAEAQHQISQAMAALLASTPDAPDHA